VGCVCAGGGEVVLQALGDRLLVVSELVDRRAQFADGQHDARTPANASPMHVVCPALRGLENDPLLESTDATEYEAANGLWQDWTICLGAQAVTRVSAQHTIDGESDDPESELQQPDVAV